MAASANLTTNGNILLQSYFRTVATKVRLKGTRAGGTIDFTKISDDALNWGQPGNSGTSIQDPVSFFIELLPTGGLYETEEIQFLDSTNRRLLTIALPVDGTSNPTYSYYVNGATSGTVRDGSSGKYTLATARVYFTV